MSRRMTLWVLLLVACGERPQPEAGQVEDSATHGDAGGADTVRRVAGRVSLSEAAFASAGIVVQLPRPLTGREDVTTINVPGQVEADPSRVALITPRTDGRLERITAAVGQRVEAGQTVAYLLSPAFLTAQSDLVQAVRRAGSLAGTADSASGRRLLLAARRRLALLGAPAPAIEAIERTGETIELLPILAPFAGSLVEALALPGAAVSIGTPIFRLVDLSQVDVLGNVPEAELPHLAVGRSAEVIAAAYPETPLAGRIERIKDELDPATRTVAAVVHVANPRGTLKPGMFATVRIAVPLARRADTGRREPGGLIIPESAIVVQGNERFVFVETGPRTYERRLVEAVSLNEIGSGVRRVLVSAGLAPTDRVVVAGGFVLKSELAKGELEEH